MLIKTTTRNTQARDVLGLFANYGFRKASMGDIANAAGVSRQSIYNQHGSKEAVLEWALSTFLHETTDTAIAALSQPTASALEAVHAAFQAWIGQHVDMMRGTPHGGALLETAIASAANSERDYEHEFSQAVAGFLSDNGFAADATEAAEMTFVLQTASKGLLLKSKSAEDFADGMRRVLGALCKP